MVSKFNTETCKNKSEVRMIIGRTCRGLRRMLPQAGWRCSQGSQWNACTVAAIYNFATTLRVRKIWQMAATVPGGLASWSTKLKIWRTILPISPRRPATYVEVSFTPKHVFIPSLSIHVSNTWDAIYIQIVTGNIRSVLFVMIPTSMKSKRI